MKELINLIKNSIEFSKEAFATYAAKLTLQGDTGERSAWSVIIWAYIKTIAIFFVLFFSLFALNSWNSEIVYYVAPIVSMILVIVFLWVYVLTLPIVLVYEVIKGKRYDWLEYMRDFLAILLFIGLFFTYIPISGSGGFFLVPTIMMVITIILLVAKKNRERQRKYMTYVAYVILGLSVFYMIAPERASDWYGSAWEFVTGKEYVPRGGEKVKYVDENGDPCIIGKDGKPAPEIYGENAQEHALGYGHVDVYPGEVREFKLPTPLIRVVGNNTKYSINIDSPNISEVKVFKRKLLNGRDVQLNTDLNLSDVRILHVKGEGILRLTVY